MTLLRALIIVLALVSALHAGAAQAWRGIATRVSDGDTLWVRPAAGGKPVKVRIDGIDAPEICQAGGQASRIALARRLQGRQIEVHARRIDDYGRTVASLHVQDEDIASWMVDQGHAWSYGIGRAGGPYAAQQSLARAASRGLFASPAPMEPREFRRRHGSCHARYNPESPRADVLHGIR